MKTLGGAAGEVLRSPKTRLFGSFCLPLPATSTLEPLLEPLFIQSQKVNSANFALMEFSEVRGEGSSLARYVCTLPAWARPQHRTLEWLSPSPSDCTCFGS